MHSPAHCIKIGYTQDEKLSALLFISCYHKRIETRKYRELAEWLGVYHYANPDNRGIIIPFFPLSRESSSDYYFCWQYSMLLEMMPIRVQKFLSEYLNGLTT